MTEPIPSDVLACDAQLHAVLERVAFSQFLNPTNGLEAHRSFRPGSGPPRLHYLPFTEADEVLRQLDEAEPKGDHPAAELVRRCVDGVRLLALALRDRTAEAFDRLNESSGWYPSAAELELVFPARGSVDFDLSDVSSAQLEAALRKGLDERGLFDWTIERDAIMSARVLVDSAKRLLRIHPEARFHRRDLERLVVHEIDVHVIRGENGAAQALRCFETGLPSSLLTEEGLAVVAEEVAGVATPGALARQSHVLRAVDHARRAGFREVYDALTPRVGEGTAWGIAVRIKRGLADPEAPGVYAKDTVYLRGAIRVRDFLDRGGAIADLYVGKVGVDDPVALWREQGWVKASPVPALWDRLARPPAAQST